MAPIPNRWMFSTACEKTDGLDYRLIYRSDPAVRLVDTDKNGVCMPSSCSESDTLKLLKMNPLI